jgi:hypothetical protein
MAWTTPTTWSNGVAVTASDLNTHVRDNLRYLKGLDGVPYIENAIELAEQATPATPATGRARLWPATSGLWYGIDDAANTYALGQFRARVYNSADITLTTGVAAALTFNTQRTNVGSLHSTGSNPSRLTAPVAGFYLVGGNGRFASNATGFRQFYLRLNGTTIFAIHTVDANSSTVTDIAITTGYQLAANDYVELVAAQNSGGNLNVTAAGNYSPEFWMLGPF